MQRDDGDHHRAAEPHDGGRRNVRSRARGFVVVVVVFIIQRPQRVRPPVAHRGGLPKRGRRKELRGVVAH